MTTKPDLILHIGMGKTGTTALQEAFWANRGVLARDGVTYPSVGAVSAAHHLITPFVPKSLASNGWTFLKPGDWAPKLAASGAKRILMSSELIAWASPKDAADFCSALVAHFNLKVCLYLRRQDNIIMAGYNQQIKAGNQTNPIGKILDRLIETFDFAATIDTWEKAAGAENLMIRPYERAQFPGGDLIADFMTGVLGMPVPADFKHPPKDNSNPRFSHVALEYKRLINAISADAKTSGVYTGALMEFSQTHDTASAAVFFEQGLLSIEDRNRILTHFADQNRTIARRFLGRDTLFLDDLSQDAAVAPAVAGSDLTAVSDWLAKHHPRLARSLTDAATLASSQNRAAVKRAGLALGRSFGAGKPGKAKAASKPAVAKMASPAAPPQGPRVIIHPGLPKTGTTAIQEAFFKNRAVLLRDHGILYPEVDENHTQPILALFRADAMSNIRFAGMTEAKLADYRAASRHALERQIRAGGWHTLILSGEGISTLNPQGWADFLAWLNDMGLTRSEVIFGVRNGLDLVRSSIQQNIKSGMLLEQQYENPPILRAKARLAPILASMGKDRIRIWDFDTARVAPLGLVHHFCASLGLSPQVCDLLAATPVFQNESLTQTGVDALAERNRGLATPKGISGAEQAHFLSLKGPKFALPPEVTAKVARAMDMDALWLERTFPKAARAERPNPVSPNVMAKPTAMPAPVAGPSLRLRMMALAERALTLVREGRSAFAPDTKVTATAETREIVVHFGIRKTGSSSIQQTLFDAGAGLQGVAYVHGKLPNSSLMVRNAFLDSARLGQKIGGADQNLRAARARETGKGSLTAALNRAGGRSPRLILSAEAIADFKERELNDLAEALAPFATKTTWIGYIRDPASYARSAFQESVKQAVPESFRLDSVSNEQRKYHQIVDRLDARFGRENVRAFAFDRANFPQGDVVRHFLQVAGLDPATVDIRRVNESLSLLGVKLLFIYRRLLVSKDAPSVSPGSRQAFIRALEGLKGPGFAFHPDIERQIERSNQVIFDWAEQRLGQSLPRGANQKDTGIRSEADLMTLTPDEMAQFADFAAGYGITDLKDRSDAQAVAEAVRRIRQAVAST